MMCMIIIPQNHLQRNTNNTKMIIMIKVLIINIKIILIKIKNFISLKLAVNVKNLRTVVVEVEVIQAIRMLKRIKRSAKIQMKD